MKVLIMLSLTMGSKLVNGMDPYSLTGNCSGNEAPETSPATCVDEDTLALMQVQFKMQRHNMRFRRGPEFPGPEKCQSNPETCMRHSERELWKQAVLEAGMSEKDISEFGRSVVKYPKSFVERMFALKNRSALKHTYNFVGSMSPVHPDAHPERDLIKQGRRQWAIDFAKINFTSSDIFVCSGCEGNWEVLGAYDKTKEVGDRASHWIVDDMDFTYWGIMMSSKFTLCPGGNFPFSIRAYEAALAGSICVIKSFNDDWKPKDTKHVLLQPVFDLFKYAVADEPHVYDKSVVDHNLRVFIRYLTFIEGDNVPLGPHSKDGLKQHGTL